MVVDDGWHYCNHGKVICRVLQSRRLPPPYLLWRTVSGPLVYLTTTGYTLYLQYGPRMPLATAYVEIQPSQPLSLRSSVSWASLEIPLSRPVAHVGP